MTYRVLSKTHKGAEWHIVKRHFSTLEAAFFYANTLKHEFTHVEIDT